MRSGSHLVLLLFLMFLAACGGGGSSSSQKTLVSITLSPGNSDITAGTTLQFSATGKYSDNTTQDLTSSSTWSSSNTAYATISNSSGSNGLATAVASGSTTISAAYGSVSSKTTLTVSSATLSSLTLKPSTLSLAVGGTQQFSATGNFSGNTTQDMTSLVTWSSSDSSVATISNTSGTNGAVTTLAAGKTTITASITISSTDVISQSTTLTVYTGGSSGQANIMPITVNGSLCSSGSYMNKPCVSVTICTPGTSTCQTINDILLDTGSYGLRIFNSVLSSSLSLTQSKTSNSALLAECVVYGDKSSNWGPIQLADVVLGGESAVTVPIQVINKSFATPPSSCSNADSSPSEAGFNGILGIGLMPQDCGASCVASSNVGWYFACSGSGKGASCSGTTVSLTSQVQNPVALLKTDNNGVIVQLPAVGASGAASLTGSLVLGIGTQTNNTPPETAVMYPASDSATFITTTTFGGKSDQSFIDSGSNALYFYDPTIPTDQTYTWFCPSTTLELSATNSGYSGSPSGTVSFQLIDYNNITSSSNNVFNVGGTAYLSDGFDWGLPFFFGRNIYVGIEGTSSSLGSGPYWAY